MINQVNPLYMSQGELTEYKAQVVKIGSSEINKKRYNWIQVNETIFHPKGGGQPSDEGTINGCKVAYVHKEISDKSNLSQFKILHCFEENQVLNFKEGDEVLLQVDPLKRKLHSRFHTAGHVIAEAVQKNFPGLKAYQGNHSPENAYVRFQMLDLDANYDKEEIRSKAFAELQSWIDQDVPISEQMLQTGIRSIKITQDWSDCGGTHLRSLKDLGALEIGDISINKKESTVTVKYSLK